MLFFFSYNKSKGNNAYEEMMTMMKKKKKNCVNYPFKTFIYVLLLSFPPNISSLHHLFFLTLFSVHPLVSITFPPKAP